MAIPHVEYGADAQSAQQNALIDQCNANQTNIGARASFNPVYTEIDRLWTGLGTSSGDSAHTRLDTVDDALDSLDTAVSGKAALQHTHPVGDVTGLQTALDGKASTAHTHALPLDALTDVDTSTAAPAAGQVLKFDGSVWAPGNDLTGGGGAGTGGASTLSGLDDVALSSPTQGQVLGYTGTTWINQAPAPAAAAYRGSWTDAGGQVAGTRAEATSNTSPGYLGVKVSDIGVSAETPVGCSMSAGTFTAQIGGRWRFSIATQYLGGNTAQRAIWLGAGSANTWATGPVKYGQVGGPSLDAQATGHEITVPAGGTVSVYMACWTIGGRVELYRSKGNILTATWLGP